MSCNCNFITDIAFFTGYCVNCMLTIVALMDHTRQLSNFVLDEQFVNELTSRQISLHCCMYF